MPLLFPSHPSPSYPFIIGLPKDQSPSAETLWEKNLFQHGLFIRHLPQGDIYCFQSLEGLQAFITTFLKEPS